MFARLALGLSIALTAGCASDEHRPATAPARAEEDKEASVTSEAPPSAPITRVEITVHRPPGQAYCSFSEDGAIRGGHLSGDDPPFVHEEAGRLDEADRAEIFALAGRAGVLIEEPPHEPPPPERVELELTRADGSGLRARWPIDAPPDAPELRALADAMMRHRVGGW